MWDFTRNSITCFIIPHKFWSPNPWYVRYKIQQCFEKIRKIQQPQPCPVPTLQYFAIFFLDTPQKIKVRKSASWQNTSIIKHQRFWVFIIQKCFQEPRKTHGTSAILEFLCFCIYLVLSVYTHQVRRNEKNSGRRRGWEFIKKC